MKRLTATEEVNELIRRQRNEADNGRLLKKNNFPQETEEKQGLKALRYNSGKPDWTLLDYPSLLPLVKVMEQGAKKYSRDNWKLPNNNKMEPLQSAMRHLIALIGGEEFDKESGERHTGHIMANMMFYNFRNPL